MRFVNEESEEHVKMKVSRCGWYAGCMSVEMET